jgi:hypothetical protein
MFLELELLFIYARLVHEIIGMSIVTSHANITVHPAGL